MTSQHLTLALSCDRVPQPSAEHCARTSASGPSPCALVLLRWTQAPRPMVAAPEWAPAALWSCAAANDRESCRARASVRVVVPFVVTRVRYPSRGSALLRAGDSARATPRRWHRALLCRSIVVRAEREGRTESAIRTPSMLPSPTCC